MSALSVIQVVELLGTGEPGGQVMDLATGLSAAGARVLVLAEAGRLSHELARRGVACELGPLPRRAFLDRRRLRALRALVDKHAPSPAIVHGHGAGAAAPAALLSRHLRADLVLTLGERTDVRAAPALGRARLRAVFVSSVEAQEELVNHRGVSRDLVRLARPGLDLGRVGIEEDATPPPRMPLLTTSDEKLIPATDTQASPPLPRGPSSKLAMPTRVPVIGALGPLVAESDHETLLRAAAILKAQGLEFSLLVVGDGPEKPRLFARAGELGVLDRTVLAGDLPGRGEAYDAMTVFAAPGAREAFGHDLLEAMARALPVVAAGTGGTFAAIEDGVTGLLVPPSDAGALAQALARLLGDPEAASALGERARASVQDRFPVRRLVEETLEAYERAVPVRG